LAGETGPWYVSPQGDDANNCHSPKKPCATINGGITKAFPDDTIYVAEGTYTGVGLEVVSIAQSVKLSGGWDPTFTTQSGSSVVDGQGSRRAIEVHSRTVVTIERFTIRNGIANAGGAGIENVGTLVLRDSTIEGNLNGGILNENVLTVVGCTIVGN